MKKFLYFFIYLILFHFTNRISGVVYDSNSKESIIVVVYSNQEIVKGQLQMWKVSLILINPVNMFEISFIGYSNFKKEKTFVNKSFVLDDIF